jgi:homospermidine synthase
MKDEFVDGIDELGGLVGAYTDWTPLDNRRRRLFPEDVDLGDLWQFKNIIVR